MKIFAFLLCFTIGGGHFVNAKPMVFAHLNDDISDISGMVLREAYSKLNIEIQMEYLPGRRSLLESNFGAIDGELNRGQLQMIEQKFPNLIQIPIRINIVDWRVFSKKEDIEIQGFQSLTPYSIAIMRGILFVEKKTEGMKTQLVNTFDDVVKVIDKGRVDVGIIPMAVGLNILKEQSITTIKILSPPLEESSLFHFLHKKHATLVQPITEVLREMEKQGRIQEIRENYIDDIISS